MDEVKGKVQSLTAIFASPVPWAFLTCGMALIYWGIVLPELTTNPAIKSPILSFAAVVKDLGRLVIGAGVAATIWQYLRFRNYLQQAVSDVFFSDEYLSKQTSEWLEEHLVKTGTALQTKSLPDIADDLFKTVLENYTVRQPNGESLDSYHKTSDRVFIIDWENAAQGIVRMRCEMSTTMIPRTSSDSISLHFGASVNRATSDPFKPTIDFCHLIVNGAPQDLKEIINRKVDVRGQIEEHSVSCNKRVSGCKSYYVEVATERTFMLSADPIVNSTSKRFAATPTVDIQCIPSDLCVSLIALGTPLKFDKQTPRQPHPSRVNDCFYVYPGLVFPGQGFILVLSKC